MYKNIGFILSILIIFIEPILVPSYLCASKNQQGTGQWVAELVSLQGEVSIKKAGLVTWHAARLHDRINAGDVVRTGLNSRATLLLSNDAVVRLGEKTSLAVSGAEKGPATFMKLLEGVAHFFSRFPRSLQISTPFVNAAIEGTEFTMSVHRHKADITVFSGRVRASNEFGSIILGHNQSAMAAKGRAPVGRVLVHPQDAVQWALYYPSILDLKGLKDLGKAGIDRAVALYRDGKVPMAIEILSQLKAGRNDPWAQVLLASMYLAVGQSDRAGIHLDRAIELRAGFAPALALKAIMAVTLNRKQEALALSEQAMSSGPGSVAAMIARSYALQAVFKPERALVVLQKAVVSSPQSSLAWARLSELWLCVGDVGRSLDAARKAAALDPGNARSQSVLGYAFLACLDTDDALEAFKRAISMEPADPSSRLGLGLARIKAGDLERGLVELEIAAALDPGNSLIRSYLGKAYYAKCRPEKAAAQFLMAQELDPKDPTPWFYQAILKQSINRPIEALEDLQKSIELNDNRAVYRSRLLLDQDLGSRSTSLARIYNDLGFDQLALLEGWKSLDYDPGSYPAHRFLADSYSSLPRHEIARVSELLRSQLLQTVNITPVQPHLAESKHFIYTDTGPSLPSYNEYSPLFMSDRLALQANGLAGSRGTWGDEVVQAGLVEKFSYSLGQFHYQTNGFRQNHDQHHDIYNVFVQSALAPSLNLQAEYRYSRIKKGDLFLRFDPDSYFPDLRDDEKRNSLRLGMRYGFRPSSTLLASLILADTDWDTRLFSGYSIKDKEKGFLAEIQHLYRDVRFNLVSGAGWFKTNQEIIHAFGPSGGMSKRDIIHQTNLYAYPRIHLISDCTVVLGASADFYEGAIGQTEQLNPKLGLVWNINRATVLRLAAFRVLKRLLVTDQTLEPTEVAGFNQFFDDPEGTRSWRYGIGLDHHILPRLYGGLELSRRDLDVPDMELGPGGEEVYYTDWREDLARAYLYWIASRRLVASAEYRFEKFKRKDYQPGEEDIVSLETHRLPISLGFFHPNGLGARLTATGLWQSGLFGNSAYGVYPGSDHSWILDVSLRYRLPRRHGMLELKAKNLLDHRFRFQDTDPANPSICPKRLVFARITLWF